MILNKKKNPRKRQAWPIDAEPNADRCRQAPLLRDCSSFPGDLHAAMACNLGWMSVDHVITSFPRNLPLCSPRLARPGINTEVSQLVTLVSLKGSLEGTVG